LAREGPVSFIALLDAFLGQIVDGLYGDKLWSYFLSSFIFVVPGFLLDSNDFRSEVIKLRDPITSL
jgi:hypothetical protein